MSLQATAAHSSRIRKSRKPGPAAALGLRRSTSSPRKNAPSSRTSPGQEEQLDDSGVIVSLAADLNFRDVPQFMEYIRNHMFSPIPEKGSGMSSARIAEVLNYRKALPPVVSIAHIDALSVSPTRTEREIFELAQAGILRRVTIPRRGTGAAAIGDGIASVREWQRLIDSHSDIDEGLKAKSKSVMTNHPTASSISSAFFTPAEISVLAEAGFLTNNTALDYRFSEFAAPESSSSASSHAAGTAGAVRGTSHVHGGSGASVKSAATGSYSFSLPNTGSYIKLIVEARTHLLSLLKKSSHREAPIDVLKERWDGNTTIASGSQAEKKKARGEFTAVLPSRTKKWKRFYGLRFEWILEECVGAGLIELFETRSVGNAARIVG